MSYDVIVIGCGYAGSIMARKFAEDKKKVLIIEKRNHIAGNMYDSYDENGILVHRYGPHITYINSQSTYDYLNQFTDFVPYEHTVNAEVNGIEVPLPFNLTAIDRLFKKEKAKNIIDELLKEYKYGIKIPILNLRKSSSHIIQELAEFVYEKVFLYYTLKMWDLSPDEIDPSVTARVPVHISYDNRHFTSPIQVMPKYGYTVLFKNILDHPNIKLVLSEDGLKHITLKDNIILFDNITFKGVVVYTGTIDCLFKFKYGELPYRSLYFKHKTYPFDRLQQSTVLNWPDDRPETRRTENKLLVCQPNIPGITSIMLEYPGKFHPHDPKWNEPYYPIPHKNNDLIYKEYKKLADKYSNLIMIGRLAEYKYYNMEAIIQSTISKYNNYINK